MKKVVVYMIFLLAANTVFAQGPPPANVVADKVVQQELAETQTVIGVLYYERQSDVSTEVSGLVESIAVQQGDKVEKGDMLVQLNTEVLDEEIALTKTRIDQINLLIENTQKNYDRIAKLYAEAGVSEKSYEDALYSYQDAVKEKKVTSQNLQKLLIQKKRSVIRAPFSGIILTKGVDSGGWVNPGTVLVSLGSSNDVYVRAPVPETLLQFVTFGDRVSVNVTAFNREVEGTIVNIEPVADVKTKNIFLKITIPELPLIAQNMSASVTVASSVKRKLSVFKRAAIVKFQGKNFIYTIKEGKAAILPINIVTYFGDMVGVDNPYIVPGMMVVTEGNERLRPDQPVAVAGEKE